MTALAAWLGAYLVHSTLLVGGALLAQRWLRSIALREIVLRSAILGAIASSTMATGRATARVAPPDPTPIELRIERVLLTGSPAGPAPTILRLPALGSSADMHSELRRTSETTLGASGPLTWLVLLWVTVASLLSLGLILVHVRLRMSLRSRRPAGVRARAMLARVAGSSRRRRPLRCSTSAGIVAPVALGDDEVCLADGLRLTDEQLEAVLAHEVAHLERRDPHWFPLVDALSALLWLQPLNWLVRRRLRELAEFLCDDAVVRHTGAPRAFAESLLHVAELIRGRKGNLAAVGLAQPASPFVRRVARLLAGQSAVPSAVHRRVVVAGSLALVGGVAAFVPGAAGGPARRVVPAVVGEELLVVRRAGGGLDTLLRRSTP